MAQNRVWKQIRWSLAHRGLGGTVRAALRRRGEPQPAATHSFDQRAGTDTAGVVGGGRLAVGSVNDAHITAYAGVPPVRLLAALDRWEAGLGPEQPASTWTFVDLGCGKGRAMLLASERSFRSVAGVELNPGLTALAQSNVERWQAAGLARCPMEVVEGDAAAYAYPEGSLLVFIYNSFGVPVVRQVLNALERHVRSTGCRVELLFQNEGPEMPLRTDPRLEALWSSTLPLEEQHVAEEPVSSPEDVTSLYRWIS